MTNVQCLTRVADRPSRVDWLPESSQREEHLLFTVHELSHRTKNLLSVIQAIASQTRRRSVSLDDFECAFLRVCRGCRGPSIFSLPKTGDARISWIWCVASSNRLARSTGSALRPNGPSVWLNSEATRNIGLALHELATNAIKHGALSVSEGFITVDWEVRPDDTGSQHFHLIWREHNGPAVQSPQHRGFGHAVLQRMTHQACKARSTTRSRLTA